MNIWEESNEISKNKWHNIENVNVFRKPKIMEDKCQELFRMDQKFGH